MQPEPEEGPANFMGWTWAGKSWSLTPRGLTCWMALAMASMAARGPAASDYLVHQQSFLEALAAVRACQPLESELREAASKLCSLYQRCDVERVAEYYLALSPDERRAGLDAGRGRHGFPTPGSAAATGSNPESS